MDSLSEDPGPSIQVGPSVEIGRTVREEEVHLWMFLSSILTIRA
jgi:hypothetical protein